MIYCAMNNEDKTDTVPQEGGTVKATDTGVQKAAPDKLPLPARKKSHTVLQWVMISIGSFMMAISVYFFQTPNNITLGGVAGIAFLLEKVALSQGVWMVIINGTLLLLGLIVLGKQCTVRTIYSSALYTGLIYLFELIGKAADIQHPVTGGSTFLALSYAILLFGVGGALIFNCGASSGGTDIIALILKKFTRLNVGMALMLIDFLIVCISFYTFHVESAGRRMPGRLTLMSQGFPSPSRIRILWFSDRSSRVSYAAFTASPSRLSPDARNSKILSFFSFSSS